MPSRPAGAAPRDVDGRPPRDAAPRRAWRSSCSSRSRVRSGWPSRCSSNRPSPGKVDRLGRGRAAVPEERPDRTSTASSGRDRPRRERPEDGHDRPDRRARAAGRGEEGGHRGERHRARSGRRSSPDWTSCTASWTSRRSRSSPSRRTRASTSRASSGGPMARRTSSTRRPSPSTGSTSPISNAVAIFREGTKAAGATEAAPAMITVGGPDLLILDAKNVLWRWRPADAKGRARPRRSLSSGSSEWGTDLLAIGTFVRDARAGLYNFYIVDPSAAGDPRLRSGRRWRGLPGRPDRNASRRLARSTASRASTSTATSGSPTPARSCGSSAARTTGWAAGAASRHRASAAAPEFTAVMSGSDRRAGKIYGYDPRTPASSRT